MLAPLLALAFLIAASTSALAGPCVTATTDCTEYVSVRGGPSRLMVYRSAPLDLRDSTITDALIVIHGAERDAGLSFRIALGGAVLMNRIGQTLVVAPRFAANAGTACTDPLAANELNWQCDVQRRDWRAGGDSTSDPTLASFDALDALLGRIVQSDAFPNLKSVVVAGHSAGGQFVTNYQMANRLHEQLRVRPAYVAANASVYAYPDSSRPMPVTAIDCPAFQDWPFGIQARSGYTARPSVEDLTRFATTRPVAYLVGELDNAPLEQGGFFGSCAARAQGRSRRDRGVAFGKHMADRYKAAQETIVVPGCGHSEFCMFTSRPGLRALFLGLDR
jgi:hypothetical protein